MKFECLKWRERKKQKFDPEKITLKMGNKEFNVYNMIQEAREDTEIVPTLEKYGSIERLILNKEELYQDFSNMEKQRSLADQIKYADNMFYTLPLEIRQEFKNNKYEFMKNGKKWVENKIKAEKLEKEEKMKQHEMEIQKNVQNNSNTVAD